MTKSNFSCIVFQTRLKCGHMWQIILVKNLIFFCIKEYRINQYLLLVVVKLPFIEFVIKVFSWFYQFLSIIYIPKNQSPMLITLSIVPKLVRIAAISIFSEKSLFQPLLHYISIFYPTVCNHFYVPLCELDFIVYKIYICFGADFKKYPYSIESIQTISFSILHFFVKCA